MLFWDEVVFAFRFCLGLSKFLEFVGERDIVEEGPGIVEFVVPGSFEVTHGGDEVVKFFIAD